MGIKLAVMVSGRGSNLKAIIEAVKAGNLDATIECVISNEPDAPALEIARQNKITAVAVAHKGLSKIEHENKILDEIKDLGIDYVVLAGYMRIISANFLKHFQDKLGYYKVINIHPSLLPAFPGRAGYEDAYYYGVKVAGVTIHLVDEEVDHGPILAQQPFPRFPGDTLESFKERGLSVEHALYPAVLQQIATKGIPSFCPVYKRTHAETK